MTKKEQRKLTFDRAYLATVVQWERKRNRDLVEANANLQIERDATDVLLGEAMDALKEKKL